MKIDELEKELKIFNEKGMPFAARGALDSAAFKTRSTAQTFIGLRLVERNKWTRGSVRVNRAKGRDLSRMFSEVGSTEEYMATQELGGTKRSLGGRTVAIPTAYAAGQENAKPRTRLPRKPNKMVNIRLRRRRVRSKNPKQALVVTMNLAARSGERYIYLGREHGLKRRAIFRVLGGRYRGREWPGAAKLKMVAEIDRPSVRIPRTQWLEPASKTIDMEELYRQALIFQLRRLRLFKD